MGYSIDPISEGCYPNTTVLINKFDIRDEEKLNEVESVLTSARYAEWLNAPKAATFDFEHYKAIHHFLFSDLYGWAGQIRTVNTSKKGTLFTPTESIGSQAELIFKRLKEQNYFKGLSHDAFVEEIVDFYCVTNALHPLLEGNGRTQRIYFRQWAGHLGLEIDFSKIDADRFTVATIHAAQGVMNDLVELFGKLI